MVWIGYKWIRGEAVYQNINFVDYGHITQVRLLVSNYEFFGLVINVLQEELGTKM